MRNSKQGYLSVLKTRWNNRKRLGGGREFIGKLSGGIMLPIAVLPIAGLLLGIGSAILNQLPSAVQGWNGNPEAYFVLRGFAGFIANSGNFIFANLAVLFAIGIAIAFTGDAGVAGLAALIAWISFNGMQQAMAFDVAPEVGVYQIGNRLAAGQSVKLNVPSGTQLTNNNLELTNSNVIEKIVELTGFNIPKLANSTNFDTTKLAQIPISNWNNLTNTALTPINNSLTEKQVENILFAQAISENGTFTPKETGLTNLLYWRNLKSEIFTQNVGIRSLQSSVFGGALIGSITAIIYNKTHRIQMPKILGFFSGARFVPIASLLAMMPTSVLFAMVWPGIGILLGLIGSGLGTLSANGGVNALIFGFLERSLVPTGLHHAFYSPLWYTSAGGSFSDAGSVAPLIRKGDLIYAITSVKDSGAGISSWKEVIEKLNPGYVFDNDIGSWQGDQRVWFALNRYLMGKTVYLNGIAGRPGTGIEYVLTYKTFAQNTLNNPLPTWDFVADNNRKQLLENVITTGNSGFRFNATMFKPAFPGVNPGQYEQGKFPFMIFGLPAAAAAMVMAAPKDQRKTALSIVGSAGLTSLITGITEPIEFTFLFLAPWLFWGVHTIYAAISFWLMSLLGANVSQTFSGGIIDLGIYGFLPDGLGYQVNSYWAIVIGIGFIPIYYFTFYFAIIKRNLQTPGRGGTLKTKKDYLALKTNKNQEKMTGGFSAAQVQAYHLIEAFGGEANITNVNACITKLRVSVKDQAKVNKEMIKDLGAQGVMDISPTLSHAIFGVDSEPIKTQMNQIIQNKIDKVKLKEFVENASSEMKADAEDKAMKAVPETEVVNEITIYSPLSGTVKAISEVNDETFAKKILGDGIAIVPDEGLVSVPSNKQVKVDVAFPTGHAFIVDVDGAKLMIHLGIETVGLNPNPTDPKNLVAFTTLVNQGEITDQDLSRVDFDLIKSKNLDPITPVIVLQETLDNYQLEILVKPNTHVDRKQPIYKLTWKK